MTLPGIDGEDFLTIEEVAERLSCHPNHLRKMVQRGDITPIALLGGAMAFRVSEVDRYLAEKNNPNIMTTMQLADYYGITYRRARELFGIKFRSLSVGVDTRGRLLYDMSRTVHRHIETMYRLVPRSKDGEAT